MNQRAYSPKEIGKIKTKKLALEGKWKEAFGEPSETETWFIHGPSASGKSSFVMQLTKMLCGFGPVLYVSLEEGVGLSFQQRLKRFRMDEVQGRLRIITDDSIESLKARLKRQKSAKYIVIDSFQYTEWTYPEVKALIDEFPRKGFIFISQEDKGRPIGKAAVRLKFAAGIKIRALGYKAYCLGRYIGDAAAYYPIWEEGIMKLELK